jgi:hypothetical protein
LKNSSATSAKATGLPRRTGRSSGSKPSPISAEVFALTGPSNPPNPAFNAYRKDLADIALADQVIASHYAEPLPRVLARDAQLRIEPTNEAEVICRLNAGDLFDMLDDSVGWAWGYAGSDRCVGYVESDALK